MAYRHVNKFLPFGLRALLLVVIDQASKYYVRKFLGLHVSYPVIGGLFSLTHIENSGAAFGFLAGVDSRWVAVFFVAVSLAASAFIVYIYGGLEHGDWVMKVSLTLIFGGAVGNLCDRVMFGTVTDFLDFYIGTWHWYTFNIADSCITVGAILALAHPLLVPKKGAPE